MPTTKKTAARKKPAGKAVAKATAKRTTGRKKPSASKTKGAGLATRAQRVVPKELKKTALRALAGAAAGAVRAIIPPLQQAVDSNEAAASPSKSRGGRQSARDR